MIPAWALAACLLSSPARASAIDLHLHLPMIEEDVRPFDLEKANVRLVVAVAYAPAVLSHFRGGYARAVLGQFSQVERWAARDARVSIVRTPDEAEAVLKSKTWRLGVILAAEGDGGADTTAKLERLWSRGLRMLTMVHFTDSRWGGAASVRYWPWPSCRPGGKADERRNPKGLSEEGKALVDWSVEKGLLLDLTHSSDKTAFDVAKRYPKLPLLFSHEAARELTPCERAVSPELLREVRRSRGLVGLSLSAGYLGPDLEALRRQARALAREAGPEAVALGSDFNGYIGLLPGVPDPSGDALVLKELEDAGVPADRSAEAFVDFWRRSAALSVSGRKTRGL